MPRPVGQGFVWFVARRRVLDPPSSVRRRLHRLHRSRRTDRFACCRNRPTRRPVPAPLRNAHKGEVGGDLPGPHRWRHQRSGARHHVVPGAPLRRGVFEFRWRTSRPDPEADLVLSNLAAHTRTACARCRRSRRVAQPGIKEEFSGRGPLEPDPLQDSDHRQPVSLACVASLVDNPWWCTRRRSSAAVGARTCRRCVIVGVGPFAYAGICRRCRIWPSAVRHGFSASGLVPTERPHHGRYRRTDRRAAEDA